MTQGKWNTRKRKIYLAAENLQVGMIFVSGLIRVEITALGPGYRPGTIFVAGVTRSNYKFTRTSRCEDQFGIVYTPTQVKERAVAPCLPEPAVEVIPQSSEPVVSEETPAILPESVEVLQSKLVVIEEIRVAPLIPDGSVEQDGYSGYLQSNGSVEPWVVIEPDPGIVLMGKRQLAQLKRSKKSVEPRSRKA